MHFILLSEVNGLLTTVTCRVEIAVYILTKYITIHFSQGVMIDMSIGSMPPLLLVQVNSVSI